MAAPKAQEHADPQAELLAFLEGGEPLGPVERRIDTHGAHVLLTRDRAWKMKRAAHYAYLDFSTRDRRREALEAELRLNRRTAPELYLGMAPVTRGSDGALALGGEGEPVEWLLEMRRFPDDALLDDIAARKGLEPPLLTALADRIVALHAEAERYSGGDGAARIAAILDGNRRSFADVADVIPAEQAQALDTLQRAELDRCAARLDARARAGRIRHGHGDLHLRNIALIDGAPVLFDCLEFDAELATVDVLYDLAFLLMDLWHRGQRIDANIVANRYLDVSPQGAGGYSLLPLFLSIRAAIRGHVAAAAARSTGEETKIAEARDYCRLAADLLAPAAPRLVAVGGLSGTGKSSVARLIGAWIGRAPGARVLRSDVFRKRLAGVSPETRLPPESYTAAASDHTYEALFESAEDHLRCGSSVILDAVFSSRSEREVAQMIAERDRVPFHGIWLEAPEQERIARVSVRSGDASDAGPTVARDQSRKSVGDLGSWLRLRANRPLDIVAQAARAFLERRRR
ncbi:bifunctional aminoglycoside phosphotransferase/ATP-binding protein [Stakelama tenebrarum]|uniref:AAA family ATPase n=1 Tax=Stakelama tenebrarum TaxID=2711215 RepID=A0A6G6Y503_9SPHN|nr:bifunctional aminoglycoside phosphotransferase/ATP-binding protein [Sphingosinithalassobacter tenebrarum]QIG79656.1 AAA family ATPase [Sphingosinithalassobacter tenebrarum]